MDDLEIKSQRAGIVEGILLKIKAIRSERAVKYKDPEDGHARLGKIWGALLEDHFDISLPPLPAELVMKMFAAQKLHRSCMDKQVDHLSDAMVYSQLALEQEVLDALRSGKIESYLKKEKH
ncbi:MAG: DUF6378 domain-containing protein [Kiritimatiellales bacterium]